MDANNIQKINRYKITLSAPTESLAGLQTDTASAGTGSEGGAASGRLSEFTERK
jgi:hypothetical protein